jgi:hypothetical protein
VITEQRFNVKLNGVDISFCPDRVEPLDLNASQTFTQFPLGTKLWRLKDFKITKVWAVKHMKDAGGKAEWTWQCRGYVWALSKIGIHVVLADIETLAKDWSKLELVKSPHDYPKFAIESHPIDLGTLEDTERFLQRRLAEHEAAADLADDDLPFCTEQERWARPDKYVVKKIGGDRALPKAGNFESQQEAQAFLEARKDKAQCEVEFRRGCSPRCEEYCPVKHLCNQWNTVLNPPF